MADQDFLKTFASIDDSLKSVAQTVFTTDMFKKQNQFMEGSAIKKANSMQGSFGTEQGEYIFGEVKGILENTELSTIEGNTRILSALDKQIKILNNIDTKESKDDVQKLQKLAGITADRLKEIKAAGSEGGGIGGKAKGLLGMGGVPMSKGEMARRGGMSGATGLLHGAGALTKMPGLNILSLMLQKQESKRREKYDTKMKEKGNEQSRIANKLYEMEDALGPQFDKTRKKKPIGFAGGKPWGDNDEVAQEMKAGFNEGIESEFNTLPRAQKGAIAKEMGVKIEGNTDWEKEVLDQLKIIAKQGDEVEPVLKELDANGDRAYLEDQGDERDAQLAYKKREAASKIDKEPIGIAGTVGKAAEDEGESLLARGLSTALGAAFGPLLAKLGASVAAGILPALSAIALPLAAIGITLAAGFAVFKAVEGFKSLGEAQDDAREAEGRGHKMRGELYDPKEGKLGKKGIRNDQDLLDYNNKMRPLIAAGKLEKDKQYSYDEIKEMSKANAGTPAGATPASTTPPPAPAEPTVGTTKKDNFSGEFSEIELAKEDPELYEQYAAYKQERFEAYKKTEKPINSSYRAKSAALDKARLKAKVDAAQKFANWKQMKKVSTVPKPMDGYVDGAAQDVKSAPTMTKEQTAAATSTAPAPIQDVASKAKAGFERSPTAMIAADEAKESAQAKKPSAVVVPVSTGGNQASPLPGQSGPNVKSPSVTSGDRSFMGTLFSLY